MSGITEFAQALFDGTDAEINELKRLLKEWYDIEPAAKPIENKKDIRLLRKIYTVSKPNPLLPRNYRGR